MTDGPKRYQIFFAELKRRKVFKVAVVYGAVSFAVLQAADIAFPRVGLPDWTVTFVVALTVLGLPIALILAWALEVTPEGVRKTDPARFGELEALVAQPVSRRWPAGLFAAAAILLMGLSAWWVFRDAGPLGDAPVPALARSIAVLPFVNMSGDPENEYFSDGITDDIITHLSKLSDLKVISRTSTMRYKETDKSLREIADDLGVATILEGGVQRSADRVRINAQLIDAATDEHLWAEQYNRTLTDVFEIQTDVALQIAGALHAQLSPEERGRVERKPTENLEAYNLYLQGRYFWNKRTAEGLQTAIEYFEDALEIDPDYAPAWVGVADSYSIAADWGYLSLAETYEKAKSAALKALEIDETLGEAHIALALIHQTYELDVEAAQAEYLRGIALSPGYATGHQWHGILLSYLGRTDEAVEELELALELDPLSLIINLSMGSTLRIAGEYERSVQQMQRVKQLDPGFVANYQELGFTYEEMGDFENAIMEYERAIELSDGFFGTVELGHVYGAMGRREEALGLFRELEEQAKTRYVSPTEFAIIHAGLGDTDSAFELLDRALEEGDATLLWRSASPGFAELRSDPRFAQLLRRLGLRE